MPYFEREHVNLYYEVYGEGLPIVFLPPAVMGHLTFRFQKPLQKHYKLIFPDLINSGRTTKKSGVSSISQMARLIYDLIEELQLEKVVLCGYSNGGFIAQEFALSYPERTSGVILIGGFPEVSTFILEKQYKLGIWAAKHNLIPLFSAILPRAHFQSKKNQRQMANFIKRADGATLERLYEMGMNYTATKRLKKLQAPLLLLYGKHDYYMHSYVYTFCKQVENIDIVFISGTAHQVPTRRPDECNQVIHQWIIRNNLVR